MPVQADFQRPVFRKRHECSDVGSPFWLHERFVEGLIVGDEPTNRRWMCPQDAHNSECEFWLFVWGLVRMVKPHFVIETGCREGWTSYAIGSALRDNGFGSLMTCDIEQIYVDATNKRCQSLPVIACRKDSREMEIERADMLFSDSGEPNVRISEIERAFGLVVVHDTEFYPELGHYVRARGMTFLTPRGFGIMRGRNANL